jgi:hypothetical protein
MGLTIDLGQNPLATGTYLIQLTMQVGWNSTNAGPLVQDGFAQYVDGTNVVETFPWGLFKNITDPNGMGTAASYTFFFQATITSANEQWIKTQGNFYLLGAQVVIFTLPTYVITSPGFV